MRTFVSVVTALCCIITPALAHGGKPRTVFIFPGPHTADSTAIVIPAGSPMRLASLPREYNIEVAFRGRFTLSGLYKVEGYGEKTDLTFWPDRKSRNMLPHWRGRDVPEDMDISGAWAFARAVVPKDQLQRLKSGKLKSVTGRVTIVADNYETSIDCDVVSASARFVSVVNSVQIAANPTSFNEC
jgi:hypothetical protein